jgi:hypothetical protein
MGIYRGDLLMKSSNREQDLLADAFYDEDYAFIEFITGKRAENQIQAEKIINEYLEKVRLSV